MNVAFISVIPNIDKPSFDKVINEDFFIELFGNKVGQILIALVLFSVIGTATTLVFTGSRMIVHAAKSKYIPIFSDKLKWDSTDNTPLNALITQFMWCSLLIIMIQGGIGFDIFGSFSNFSRYSSCFFYLLTGIGLLILRYRIRVHLSWKFYTIDTESNEYRTYKVHFITILSFIVGRLFVMIFAYLVDVTNVTCIGQDSSCNEGIKVIKRKAPYLIAIGFWVIGIICYFVYRNHDDNDGGNDGDESEDDYHDPLLS